MWWQDTPEAAPESCWPTSLRNCVALNTGPCFTFLSPPKLTFLFGEATENVFTLLTQAREPTKLQRPVLTRDNSRNTLGACKRDGRSLKKVGAPSRRLSLNELLSSRCCLCPIESTGSAACHIPPSPICKYSCRKLNNTLSLLSVDGSLVCF